ncbi:uncharacterized protein LOC130899943 [Diorhabda carinulata]|uniref:uncharacterized protein LOC130899943 n=1 Tax=Diorhabda carinulata TaxID=1163345 RepID=UPI0025A064A5|nr:uncharacterized protein LOC130899943 [Diorhabda carinulata]
MPRMCCVDGCSTREGTNISLFHCPKDEIRCQRWKQALGFVNSHIYANMTPEQFSYKLRVCELHFPEGSFIKNNCRKNLQYNAVPSLNLKNNMAPVLTADVSTQTNIQEVMPNGQNVHECKEKWKNIRSAFVRSLKPSPGSSKIKRPYYLHDHLRFILPFVKTVNSIESVKVECPDDYSENQDSIPDDTDEQEIYEEALSPLPSILIDDNQLLDVTTESSPSRKKRKLDSPSYEFEYKKPRVIDDETAIHYFLLSLIPDLKGLTEAQLRNFKIKSLLLIQEMKEKNEPNINNPLILT